MTYSVSPLARLAWSERFRTCMCVKCEKDAPHKYGRCIYCGTLNNDPFIAKNAELKAARAKKTYNQRLFDGEQMRNKIAQDKKHALRKAAEESRKKWEGT